MAEGKIFVGRKDELEQFKEVLKNPKGQAVLVVGQVGMGKTWLVNKMAEIAENHQELKCGWVRYEVTPTDSVDSTMALMMDNAFEAAQVTESSFDGTTRRIEQWRSLLNVINIGDLVMSLKRNPAKNTREQFLERLELISKRMPKEGRAIFVIDPEKYMQKESDQAWAIVVKQLPEKIKFVFAQRPEDVLVESETFGALDNLSSIPEKRLDILDEEAVDDLLNQRVGELKYSVTEVREVLRKYKGHPYALQGSLDLLKAGMELEELPESPEPTKFAQVQWSKVCKSSDGAIELFETYAVLEVGVPDDVVEAVSSLKSSKRRKLLADKYLAGLLRDEGEGKRIYHAILADYILEQIGEAEEKDFHGRAVELYRGKLAKAEKEQTKSDALAAMRLAEHVLAAEGKKAFVYAVLNESGEVLRNLGLLDIVKSSLLRALEKVRAGSNEEAMVIGNLGLIYGMRGELDKAEEMHLKSLKIEKKLGRLEGMASDYLGLGNIYYTRGDLDKAEEMYEKSLEVFEKLGSKEGMARDYGNLGLVYYTRGDLDKAEEMYEKSLEIDKKLGQLEGMASQYGNLGLVYRTKGDLDKAEDMHNKSLEIEKKLGRLEGMASDYGNLGVIYKSRGELDKAEETFKKIIVIHRKRGDKVGLATDYGNLGNVYQKRGELDKAEEMYKKSFEINKKIGRLEGMAIQYSNLGVVYKNKGELDKAEELHLKSLDIAEKLGCKEGMASAYGNLGNVYRRRVDLDKAEEMYKKAIEIDKKIGRLEGQAIQYVNLGLIYKQRGDIGKAKEYWEKAVGLYKRIGMPREVETVQGWINGIEN